MLVHLFDQMSNLPKIDHEEEPGSKQVTFAGAEQMSVRSLKTEAVACFTP